LIGSNAGIVEESFLFGVNVLIAQDPRTEGMEVIILRDDGRDLMLMKVELDSDGDSSD
jgi:hypothetical protein